MRIGLYFAFTSIRKDGLGSAANKSHFRRGVNQHMSNNRFRHGIRRFLPLFPAALVIALVFVSTGICDTIVPVSYTATLGDTSTYVYTDQTGKQLTDGFLGANDWHDGNAYEWVGWDNKNALLAFTFNGSPSIDTVKIGFNRNEGVGPIWLPSTVTIGGNNFTVAHDAIIGEATRGWLTFTGSWTTGTPLQITLTPVDGKWIFVDEVQFFGTPGGPVTAPEPSTMLLLGLGLVGLAEVRRRMGI
jgi:hypothetical protein